MVSTKKKKVDHDPTGLNRRTAQQFPENTFTVRQARSQTMHFVGEAAGLGHPHQEWAG